MSAHLAYRDNYQNYVFYIDMTKDVIFDVGQYDFAVQLYFLCPYYMNSIGCYITIYMLGSTDKIQRLTKRIWVISRYIDRL